MGDVTKFGPRSDEVLACADELRTATVEQWRDMIAAQGVLDHADYQRALTEAARGPAARHAALERLGQSVKTDPEVRARLEQCGGLGPLMRARVIVQLTLNTVANADRLASGDLLVATAPAAAAGLATAIAARALARS